MKLNLRLLYLYLFSFVGLLLIVIGSVQLVDLGLKTYVFNVTNYTYYPEPKRIGEEADIISPQEIETRQNDEESNQRKRQMSNSLSMIIVGTPLYLYHWKTIKKEKNK
jgi:hypothetical protein